MLAARPRKSWLYASEKSAAKKAAQKLVMRHEQKRAASTRTIQVRFAAALKVYF